MTTREELIAARDVRETEWAAFFAAVEPTLDYEYHPGDLRRAFMAGFDFGENWHHGEPDMHERAALVVRHHENGGVFDMLDELEAIERHQDKN